MTSCFLQESSAHSAVLLQPKEGKLHCQLRSLAARILYARMANQEFWIFRTRISRKRRSADKSNDSCCDNRSRTRPWFEFQRGRESGHHKPGPHRSAPRTDRELAIV